MKKYDPENDTKCTLKQKATVSAFGAVSDLYFPKKSKFCGVGRDYVVYIPPCETKHRTPQEATLIRLHTPPTPSDKAKWG